jgi:hypothetical protein
MRIILGISLAAFIAAGCSNEQAVDTAEVLQVEGVSNPTPPIPPVPPKSLRLEDIDFTEYSESLARFTDLEVGQSRIEAIDNVRLYFAQDEGTGIIQTSQSIFERDDGAVMLFSAAGLPDDSVKAQEIFLILSGEKGSQTLGAFGMRHKCYRGENTTDWQTDLCP